MSIIWPIDLPQKALLLPYSEAPRPNTVRTTISAGLDKVRRRSTAEVRIYSMQLILTTAQKNRFDTFFSTDTKSGSLFFDWVDMSSGAAATYRFYEPPQPYQPISSKYWQVNFTLEKQP